MSFSVHKISLKPLLLQSRNSHIVHVLPRRRSNSFQNQFYCPFYQFYFKNNSANRLWPYPKHRPDKHARGLFGAAIWQINLYCIILSTYLNSPYVAYSHGVLNCNGLHILNTFIQAYRGLSILHCFHPHISPCWRGPLQYFYIAQYPVHWTTQSALHFIPWHTCSFRHQLYFSGKDSSVAAITREDYSLTYFHHRL